MTVRVMSLLLAKRECSCDAKSGKHWKVLTLDSRWLTGHLIFVTGLVPRGGELR